MKKIEFEEFELLFKPIEIYLKDRDTINDAVDTIFPSSYVCVELGGNLLDCYIDLLEKFLEIDNNWLAWWIFDTEMGKNRTMVEDIKTGKKDDLKTLKNLFDFLTVLKN